jgi:hypothetical protein
MGKGETYIQQDKDWEGRLPAEFVEGVTGTTSRISVNNSDPQNPVIDIDAAFVVGGQVDSVVGTTDEIDVDSADPSNPVVSISPNFKDPVILGTYAATNMTGLSVKTLDSSATDVFYLYSINTNFTLTISNMTNGRTITIFTNNAAGHVTWPSMRWPEGELPDLTDNIDVVVVTMVGGFLVASAALNHSTP